MGTAPNRRRTRAAQRVRGLLARQGSPYFLTALLLTATGLAGFLTSALLRRAGLDSMTLRYPLAVGGGYLVFLSLLGLWVVYRRGRRRGRVAASPRGDDAAEFCDVGEAVQGAADLASAALASDGPATSSRNAWSLPDLDDAGGEGCAAALVMIVVLLAVGVVVAAAAAVLMEAPILLAEVLVDGVLLAGLARRSRPAESEHWAAGVLRRTWFPALVAALLLGAAGYLLQRLVLGATTVGEAFRAARGG